MVSNVQAHDVPGRQGSGSVRRFGSFSPSVMISVLRHTSTRSYRSFLFPGIEVMKLIKSGVTIFRNCKVKCFSRRLVSITVDASDWQRMTKAKQSFCNLEGRRLLFQVSSHAYIISISSSHSPFVLKVYCYFRHCQSCLSLARSISWIRPY